jgi:anhydro-N-acetylmuramic acid kinase
MSEQMAFDLPSPAAGSVGASVLAIGLMSGTSQDGVDVALIDSDGERIAQLGATACRPYSKAERTLLRRATAAAANLTERTARPGVVAKAERLINDVHAEAVESFLAANGLQRGEVAVIGFHGQTLLHRPEQRLTLQVGDGGALAARLAIPVVYDFRAADVAAGGQGAPLAPVFHRALVRRLQHASPIAVLNLGGVANVTYIDGEQLIACDTGPGNALLDDFLRLRTGEPLDTDGRAAASGTIDEKMIERLLAHPFFALKPPKSLDRNAFRGWVGDTLDGIDVENGAATLTALTAAAVARIVPHLPRLPANWIVAGGGARNPTLLRMLTERLAPARVESAHAVGWSIDSLEAQASLIWRCAVCAVCRSRFRPQRERRIR